MSGDGPTAAYGTMTGPEGSAYYGRLVAARQQPHDYVSTACQHEVHEQCRQTCKFCPARCRCACHAAASRSGGEQARADNHYGYCTLEPLHDGPCASGEVPPW